MRASIPHLTLGSCTLVAWLAGGTLATAQSRSAVDSIVFGSSLNNESLRSEFQGSPAKRLDSRLSTGGSALSSPAIEAPAGSGIAHRSLWNANSGDGLGRRELSALVAAQPGLRTSGLLATAANVLQELGSPGSLADGLPALSLGFTDGFDPGSPTPTLLPLQPQAGGQTIGLYIRNTGSALNLGGLDLKVGISGAASPKPAFTDINLLAGTVFTPGNSSLSADGANDNQLQYWSASINSINAPANLPGNGATTLIGTLTFTTVGVQSGTWTLELFSPETDLLSPDGFSQPMTLVNGSLEVVPEPGETVVIAGLLLAGWAGFRRRTTAA